MEKEIAVIVYEEDGNLHIVSMALTRDVGLWPAVERLYNCPLEAQEVQKDAVDGKKKYYIAKYNIPMYREAYKHFVDDDAKINIW
jgi:hypothetical protein